ncbi:MAG: IclR family transcriptional regulator [Proteobacteria bacterium]|nr:IclR family transcriptional regulator [Pseudomonadota bacterium]
MKSSPKSAREQPDRSVAAAERTLAILNAFVGGGASMSLGDLEQATGLFKSVILRYMISLERQNYIIKLHDGRYRLGPKLMELGHICEDSFDILSIVNPALDRIAEETGETVSFYVREGENRVCIARRDSSHSLKVSVRPGSTHAFDETSISLVLTEFADVNAQDLDDREIFRSTSGVVDVLTCSVSIPVFGASGQLKGALTVSGPIGRFDTQDARMRQKLKAAADSLSLKLGYRPPGNARPSKRKAA